MTMVVKKHKVSTAMFNKMKELIFGHYTEPENTKKSKVQSEMQERCSSEDLEKFGLWLMKLRQANKLMQK